jgi:hypothetical protein
LSGQLRTCTAAANRLPCFIFRILRRPQLRRTSYQGIFEAIVEEERALDQLYAPIKARTAADTGSMARLAFTVKRQVDMERWAATGESLLDLRTGPFRGRGQLQAVATSALLPAWQHGTAEEAAAALLAFVKANEDSLRAHRPESADLREWAQRVSDGVILFSVPTEAV